MPPSAGGSERILSYLSVSFPFLSMLSLGDRGPCKLRISRLVQWGPISCSECYPVLGKDKKKQGRCRDLGS